MNRYLLLRNQVLGFLALHVLLLRVGGALFELLVVLYDLVDELGSVWGFLLELLNLLVLQLLGLSLCENITVVRLLGLLLFLRFV